MIKCELVNLTTISDLTKLLNAYEQAGWVPVNLCHMDRGGPFGSVIVTLAQDDSAEQVEVSDREAPLSDATVAAPEATDSSVESGNGHSKELSSPEIIPAD